MTTGARNVQKGKAYERWLSNYLGKATGNAVRNGFVVESDGKQSGVDVISGPFALQTKKGSTAVPAAVYKPIASATRHAGRRVPVAVLAKDGDNLGSFVVMRLVDWKRMIDLLREHNLEDSLIVGATFGEVAS